MSTLFAFLHHLAAFAMFGALFLQFMLLRGAVDAVAARQIQRADMIYGACAGLLLVVGAMRVGLLEKGWQYYLHSAPFIAKIALFAMVGLLSIWPTIVFLGWRRALNEGRFTAVGASAQRKLKAVVHAELAGVVLILLCAAMMARGIGHFG